jgi:hypothetical protein
MVCPHHQFSTAELFTISFFGQSNTNRWDAGAVQNSDITGVVVRMGITSDVNNSVGGNMLSGTMNVWIGTKDDKREKKSAEEERTLASGAITPVTVFLFE